MWHSARGAGGHTPGTADSPNRGHLRRCAPSFSTSSAPCPAGTRRCRSTPWCSLHGAHARRASQHSRRPRAHPPHPHHAENPAFCPEILVTTRKDPIFVKYYYISTACCGAAAPVTHCTTHMSTTSNQQHGAARLCWRTGAAQTDQAKTTYRHVPPATAHPPPRRHDHRMRRATPHLTPRLQGGGRSTAPTIPPTKLRGVLFSYIETLTSGKLCG